MVQATNMLYVLLKCKWHRIIFYLYLKKIKATYKKAIVKFKILLHKIDLQLFCKIAYFRTFNISSFKNNNMESLK